MMLPSKSIVNVQRQYRSDANQNIPMLFSLSRVLPIISTSICSNGWTVGCSKGHQGEPFSSLPGTPCHPLHVQLSSWRANIHGQKAEKYPTSVPQSDDNEIGPIGAERPEPCTAFTTIAPAIPVMGGLEPLPPPLPPSLHPAFSFVMVGLFLVSYLFSSSV